MERDPVARRRRRRIAAVLLLLVLLGLGGWWAASRFGRHPDGSARVAIPGFGASAVRAPEGVRVRVEVVNTTKTRGLARRATRLLRDRGFDVVGIGTSGTAVDSTVVLDRTGHPDWAQRVAEVMGGARVEARPDSSRYLDVTVLIGASWRPPAETLYP